MKPLVSAPLPAPTPAMLFFLAWWHDERETRGKAWCKKKTAGLRKVFENPPLGANVEFLRRSATGTTLQESTEFCRQFLAMNCALCGNCARR